MALSELMDGGREEFGCIDVSRNNTFAQLDAGL